MNLIALKLFTGNKHNMVVQEMNSTSLRLLLLNMASKGVSLNILVVKERYVSQTAMSACGSGAQEAVQGVGSPVLPVLQWISQTGLCLSLKQGK